MQGTIDLTNSDSEDNLPALYTSVDSVRLRHPRTIRDPPINASVDKLFQRIINREPLDQTTVYSNWGGTKVQQFDIKTLGDGEWLNDEIINAYVAYLATFTNNLVLSCHYATQTFTSFIGGEYVLDYNGPQDYSSTIKPVHFTPGNIILIPMIYGSHWFLIKVSLASMRGIRKFKVTIYDSLFPDRKKVDTLKNFLILWMDDVTKKLGIDTYAFDKIIVHDKIPKQQNGSDCGVFMLEFMRRNIMLCGYRFSQKHIPYIRRRIFMEILNYYVWTHANNTLLQ